MLKNLKSQKYYIVGLLSTAAAILVVQTTARAADLSVDNGQNISQENFSSRWEGNYVGAWLGASGVNARIDKGSGNGDLDLGEARFNGGVNLGFTKQLGANGWLWGGEVGLSALNIDKEETNATLGKPRLKANGLAEGLVRLGYGWDKLHLYGTTGVAVSKIQTFDKEADKKSDEYRAGLALGVGAEYALSDTWSSKVELIGYDFGSSKTKFNGTEREVDLSSSALRIGMSRKF